MPAGPPWRWRHVTEKDMKVGLYLRKIGRSLHQARHSAGLSNSCKQRANRLEAQWKRFARAVRAVRVA
jgi:hypothetical protein